MEGVVRAAERRLRVDAVFFDAWHLVDDVALLGHRAHAGEAAQERVDGIGQALVGDHRRAARGHIGRQVHRHGDLTDVEGALVIRQVIPVGVGVNNNFPLAGLILA